MSRDVAQLVPSEPEILRYLDRWGRAANAEPILAAYTPRIFRDDGPTTIDIWTTNPVVIQAWKGASIVTGDPTFDRSIAQLSPRSINPNWDDQPDGLTIFSLDVAGVYSEEQLELALAGTSSRLNDRSAPGGIDGSWNWLGGVPNTTGDDSLTAQVDFTFGWGDCLSGCYGYHSVRAFVSPTTATVYDTGGDPLPSGMQLSSNTKPLPP